MPPMLFAGLLVLTVGIAALPTGMPASTPVPFAGIALIAGGALLNVWSDRQFKRAQTTVKPGERPTALVIDGAFRLSRNPMYLGMAAILAGTAWLLGSPLALICTAIFVVVVDRRFTRREEASMALAFGAAYDDYTRRVRRWL
jgi:protein-S-isoprenylcysteine O-methyltransferase Ste14